MKFLIDLLPVIGFFLAYKLAGVYVATGVIMVLTALQTLALYAIEKQVSMMQKITLGMVVVFGALTLALHDPRFIQWKPTVLYLGMAGALGFTLWVLKKNALKMLLGSQLQLPETAWRTLCHVWIAYFVVMASINAYVASFYSEADWFAFKLWGYVFPAIFIIGQAIYIAKIMKQSSHAASTPEQPLSPPSP